MGIHLVGIKALKKLNINSLDNFNNFKADGSVIGDNLIEFRENAFNTIISDLLVYIEVTDVEIGEDKMKIAFTGKCDTMGRKELVKYVEDKGFEYCSSITKDTNILLCEDISGTSSKLVKAKKNGTELISYSQFLEG